ncbi:MAG TPA: cysteine rich repeat-containing protein [Candidatus Binatia bacterium]|nr:cysteine rich repeat-containing protein [Candidatus Binatia bacterium]
MRIKLSLLVLAVVVLAPGITQIARGQMAECRADRERFCQDVRFGGGRVLRCLEQHAADLSDGCRRALGSATPAGGPAQACHDDAVRFCRDAVGNRAKMKACLQAHASDLSAGCKSALAAMKRR